MHVHTNNGVLNYKLAVLVFLLPILRDIHDVLYILGLSWILALIASEDAVAIDCLLSVAGRLGSFHSGHALAVGGGHELCSWCEFLS